MLSGWLITEYYSGLALARGAIVCTATPARSPTLIDNGIRASASTIRLQLAHIAHGDLQKRISPPGSIDAEERQVEVTRLISQQLFNIADGAFTADRFGLDSGAGSD